MAIRKDGMLAKALSTYNQFDYKYSEEVIPFGAAVMRGTDKENQCKKYAAEGAFLGIAAYRNVNMEDKREYPAQATVEVITKGYVWVKVAESVVAGDKAGYKSADNTWGKEVGGSYEATGAIFETSANSGEYAIIKL